MTCLLEARGLCVPAGEKWACRELDLCVRQGEKWGILGINGIGKTTLLHALCGLRQAQNGEIRLKGRLLSKMKRRDIARIAGILFQDSEDHFPATVLETTLIGRHPHISPWQWESIEDERIARESIKAVGLSGMETRRADTLSGGERRRLALATLLTQDPELYLLDEPTNHLDVRHQIEILEGLSMLAQNPGKALIMILHDPSLAARFCDRILLLFEDGHLIGSREEILTEANLSRLYHYRIASVEGPHGRIFFPA